MEQKQKKLHTAFKAIMWLGLLGGIRSLIQGFACVSFEPVVGIAMALLAILSMISFGLSAMGQKAGLFLFYSVCVLSVIVIGLVDKGLGQQQLIQSIITAAVYTVLLQISKDGKPAWDVIMNG